MGSNPIRPTIFILEVNMAVIKKVDTHRSAVTVVVQTSLLNRLYINKQDISDNEPNLDEMLELEIRRTLNIIGDVKRL